MGHQALPHRPQLKTKLAIFLGIGKWKIEPKIQVTQQAHNTMPSPCVFPESLTPKAAVRLSPVPRPQQDAAVTGTSRFRARRRMLRSFPSRTVLLYVNCTKNTPGKGGKSPLRFPGAGQLVAVALGLQGKKKLLKEHHSGCSPDLLFSRCLQRFCF